MVISKVTQPSLQTAHSPLGQQLSVQHLHTISTLEYIVVDFDTVCFYTRCQIPFNIYLKPDTNKQMQIKDTKSQVQDTNCQMQGDEYNVHDVREGFQN